jgi:hypothetical protein
MSCFYPEIRRVRPAALIDYDGLAVDEAGLRRQLGNSFDDAREIT